METTNKNKQPGILVWRLKNILEDWAKEHLTDWPIGSDNNKKIIEIDPKTETVIFKWQRD